MKAAAPYIDTSALAKWYLNEPRSEDFEAFIAGFASAAISRLVVIEFRCLLARRRRAGDIGRRIERRIVKSFERDIAQGFLEVRPLDDRHALDALEILSSLERHQLRTLDALHLAAAGEIGATVIATADRVMAAAAKALGFSVERFD